jgi:RNA polymerase sigma-70 factor (sigma-E family)
VTTEQGTETPREAGGDAHAVLTGLFYAHFAGLTRLAMCLVDDQAAAEDVVQDAYLALYRNWRALRDPDKALTYLRSAVLNRSRSHVRSLGRARRRTGVLHVVPTDTTSDMVQAREDSKAVYAAVVGLPRRQREVVVLRYYLDLSEVEIAEFLRVSTGSVKRHAHRALAALTRRLEVQS